MSFFVSENLKDLIDEESFLNSGMSYKSLRLVNKSTNVDFKMINIAFKKEMLVCEIDITEKASHLQKLVNQLVYFDVYCENICLKQVNGSVDLKQIKVKDDNCIIAKIHIMNNLEK
tara:strand:+ start:393 stop:740 length:348 start_codon:yes stop_codon:yes gene_type:complete